jgi:PIN domain nuclease of toxin-antitoxin system
LKLLLDTHALLWWSMDEHLSADARAAITSADNDVHVSVASIWETEIKVQAGRLELAQDLLSDDRAHRLKELPITRDHVLAAARLPPHHRDPFDRVLIGQAIVEGMRLVTRDAMFERYDVALLKA